MTEFQPPSQVNADGLRYKTKASGSPFGPAPAMSLSCIKCGIHRPRSLLKGFKLAGKVHYRCDDNCQGSSRQG